MGESVVDLRELDRLRKELTAAEKERDRAVWELERVSAELREAFGTDDSDALRTLLKKVEARAAKLEARYAARMAELEGLVGRE